MSGGALGVVVGECEDEVVGGEEGGGDAVFRHPSRAE